MCQAEAPDVFGFDEDADQVVVLQEHPDESLRAQVESAVKYCPAMALAHRGGADMALTRAEIEEFWESLAARPTARPSAAGDWRPLADWYAEDATYGWMYIRRRALHGGRAATRSATTRSASRWTVSTAGTTTTSAR